MADKLRLAAGAVLRRAGIEQPDFPREGDARVGTIDLHVPRLRDDSFFPSLLCLDARRRP